MPTKNTPRRRKEVKSIVTTTRKPAKDRRKFEMNHMPFVRKE